MSEKEQPPVDEDQEAATSPCVWWRRGTVELYLKQGLGYSWRSVVRDGH